MNLLGIDYGKKHIGLAWVDTEVGVVMPFGTIQQSDFRLQTSAVVDVVEREKIDQVIVGLPIGLDGKENKNTQKVREFCDTLKSEVHVPIATIDERFTSAEAARLEGDASIDEKAAMIILESYLNKWLGD